MMGYPACAGIDPAAFFAATIAAWLPRMRGDRPLPDYPENIQEQATPHARGSTFTGS